MNLRDSGVDIDEIVNILRKEEEEEHYKVSTGDYEFDVLVGGGFWKGSLILIMGPPGSGKTTFALRFSFTPPFPSLYFTLAEPVEKLKMFASRFSFYSEDKIKERKVFLVDFYAMKEYFGIQKIEDVKEFLRLIESFVEKYGIKKMVIDSITALKEELKDEKDFRDLLEGLSTMAVSHDMVVLIIKEGPLGDVKIEERDADAFVADGIIVMSLDITPTGINRWLQILKMRGSRHLDNRRYFRITERGIEFV